FAPPKPSRAQSSSSVAASVAKASPLSRIFKKHLRPLRTRPDIVGNQFGQRGSEQESISVEAVDVDIALPRDNPRPIVGKRRPHARALLDDLGFAESGIERVSGWEKGERGAGWNRARTRAPRTRLREGRARSGPKSRPTPRSRSPLRRSCKRRRPRAQRRSESGDAAGAPAGSRSPRGS